LESYDKYPFVSIIVVVLNMAATIGACLSSLISLDYPKDRYEIIVIDGGSVDETVKICSSFGVRCVVEKKRGRGLARNVGIGKARGEIIAFVDADCVALSDWLSIHTENHSDRSVGAVGGSVINPNIDRSSIPAILSHFGNFAEFDQKLPKRHFYHIPTCNASYKRKVLSSVRCFDAELDMYEDFLLSKRIGDSGYRIVFEPRAKVVHFGIVPTMTLREYAARERKTGAAHFRAQTIEKAIFGRLPMHRYMVLPFVPLIVLMRTVREICKLLRVRRSAADAFALPLLLLGSAVWSLSYARTSWVAGKCFSE